MHAQIYHSKTCQYNTLFVTEYVDQNSKRIVIMSVLSEVPLFQVCKCIDHKQKCPDYQSILAVLLYKHVCSNTNGTMDKCCDLHIFKEFLFTSFTVS